MRTMMIVPKDRTMDRATWKRLDGYARKMAKHMAPDIERAYMDLVLYGSHARIALKRAIGEAVNPSILLVGDDAVVGIDQLSFGPGVINALDRGR